MCYNRQAKENFGEKKMKENEKEVIKEENKEKNKEAKEAKKVVAKKKKPTKKTKLDRPTLLGIIAVCLASVGLILAILALVLGGVKKDENPYGLKFYPDGNGNYIVAAGDAKYLSEITIPETYKGGKVVGIDKEGFAYCDNLKTITIPGSVTNIGENAFEYCSSLTTVNMGGGVTDIGLYAFSNCTSLKNINLPSSLRTIGEYAFYSCSGLVNVYIPDSTISVGANAFTNCDNLSYNEYEGGYYLGNQNNPYHTLVKATGTDITSCKVHAATKVIYHKAFNYCTFLTEIDLPEGVTQIGVEAFYNCISLKTLIIPKTLTEVGDRAFSGCDALSTVYYTGDEAQLYAIVVNYDNDNFRGAYFYFNYSREN